MTDTATGSLLEAATRFADDVLRPGAAEFDRSQHLPRDIIDEVARLGLLGAALPTQYGGGGIDAVAYGDLTEVLSKACTSTRTLLTVHTSLVGETLNTLGSRQLRENYLPALATGDLIACFALSEPGVGSDAASVTTHYRRTGDTYHINGTKTWISFGDLADVFLVLANGDNGPTAFLIERDFGGVDTTPITGMIGNRATHLATVTFTDVEVPVRNRIATEGSGFSFVINTALFHGRFSIAWGGIGLAQESLEIMTRYAAERHQFGQPIAEHQLVRGMIADAWVETAAARQLGYQAARSRAQRSLDAVMDTNVAKQFAARAARRTSADAVQVLGGAGCWDGHPAERAYREAKILDIIEGSTQIQQLLIADHALATLTPRPRTGA